MADTVKLTLGSKGQNVILEKSFGSPVVTKDGVTVAKEIELENRFENIGAQMMKLLRPKTLSTERRIEMKRLFIALTTCLMIVTILGTISPAKEEKEAKSKMKETLTMSGTVTAYEPNTSISVERVEGGVWQFQLSPAAKVKGDISAGVEVKVRYKKEGEELIALAIRATAGKTESEEEKSSGE